MEEFKPRTFNFDSGVVVTLNTETVTAVASNGRTTIESKHLDNFHYIEHIEARISSFALVARTFGIGIVLIFISGDQLKALIFQASLFNNLTLWAGLLCIIIGFIALFIEMIDLFMQLGLYKRLIAKLFSTRGYAVSIGNKSGNNINFFAGEDEISLIKSLEKKTIELKKHLETNQPQQVVVTPVAEHQTKVSDNVLDDLKKLGDLFQSGILTQQEFDQKKTELLKK